MTKRRDPGTLPDAIARAMEELGGTDRVAQFLKIGRSAAYALKDPDPTLYAPMSLEQTEQLCLRGATAIVEHLALACGGAFLPPIDPSSGPLGMQAALLGQESGEALAAMFKALDDRVMTPGEARDVLPEVRQVINVATSLHAMLQAIISGTFDGGVVS